MVIYCVMASPWAHLPCTHTNRVYMCPPSLWILAVGTCRPLEEVKGVIKLALDAVIVNMELGENKLGIGEGLYANTHTLW